MIRKFAFGAQFVRTFIILILLVASTASIGYAGPDAVYRAGPGDVLFISIWKDQALSKAVTVLPDGAIAFPLVGVVHVAGKSIGQIQELLTQKITPYIPKPVLTVEIQQVNSMLIYVIGKVNHPGRFAINTNIDVLQALATAGGFNSFAERDEVKIFRKQNGKVRIFNFDYDDIANGQALETNIVLQAGDVILVP